MKRNYGFIGLVLFIGVMAYATLMTLFRNLLLTLVITTFFIVIQAFLVRYFIVVNFKVDKKQLQKGEILHVKIQVINRSFIPMPYLYIGLKRDSHFEVEDRSQICLLLRPRQKREVAVTLKGRLVGKAEVTLEHLILMDYFHLTKHNLRGRVSKKVEEVEVLLTVEELMGKELVCRAVLNEKSQCAFQSEMMNKGHFEGEVGYELLPYQEGESLRLLHWKLYLQREQELVRQRESGEEAGNWCVFVLDPLRIGDDDESLVLQDKLLTVYISFVYVFLKQRRPIRLILYQEGQWVTKEVENEKVFISVLKEMSIYRFVQNCEDERVPFAYIGDLNSYKMYFSYLVDEGLLQSLAHGEKENIRVHLVDVGDREGDGIDLDLTETGFEKTVHLLEESWHINHDYEITRYI